MIRLMVNNSKYFLHVIVWRIINGRQGVVLTPHQTVKLNSLQKYIVGYNHPVGVLDLYHKSDNF